MRMSDAMMLGTTLAKHVDHHTGFDSNDSGCAIELAGIAEGNKVKYYGRQIGNTVEGNTWVWNQKSACPECGERALVVTIIAGHLNDDHKWPIEKIADWVRSVEPAEPESSDSEQITEPEFASVT